MIVKKLVETTWFRKYVNSNHHFLIGVNCHL